jgi:hypothetical protein
MLKSADFKGFRKMQVVFGAYNTASTKEIFGGIPHGKP